VLDKWGRVVGITSMNNDWQNPRFHRAALVSVGVDLLNRYLTQFGLPQLALAASPTSSTDAGATTVSGSAAQPSVPKLVLSGRTGQVTVQIRGTGGGELSHSRTAEQKLGEQRDARIEAVGAEKSQCDESSGRTRSEARAAGSIQTFELTGLKMRFDLWAQGGHYRTAATCIAGKPVGLSGNDTAATAVAEGNGEITFQAVAVPFDLRIVWQDMPADSGIEFVGPDGSVHSAINTNGAAERLIKVGAAGLWRVRVLARAVANAAGGFGRAQVATQPLVFVEAR
jgi:hypothetical protein